MLIDWFTVVAQGINFLVLVWLLVHFLYKPILTAIDTREKGIADRTAQAVSMQAQAKAEKENFERQNLELNQEREAIIAKAVEEAGEERRKLIAQARSEFESLRAKQNETIKRERASISRQLVTRTSEEVFEIARKTLSDLASASLEERMVDAFIQRVRALSPEDKSHLSDGFNASAGSVKVRSTFDILPAGRAAINCALSETLSLKAKVDFETAPELVSGIELVTKGFKVSWSIASYLDSLERVVSETLKDEYANQDVKESS